MKKTLIALAVMAAAGAASAQSSVTLFGIVDATLMWGRGGNSGSHLFQVGSSGYNSSRIGFRGTEDLGNGNSASFWLEAFINTDTGTGFPTNTNNQNSGTTLGGSSLPGTGVASGSQGLVFQRRSTVSLAGRWGELRLGRDYSPSFWNLTVFDPFGTVGVGTNQMQNGPASRPDLTPGSIVGVLVRTSNSVAYHLAPNMGGLYGQLQMWRGENASNTANHSDGNGYGARVGFASGPFNVALGYSHTSYVAGNVRYLNLGGQWDFGMAKLMGQVSRDEFGSTDGRGWLIGALVPVGAGEIRASFSRYRIGDPSARKLALGYVHNLSKRTALYTTYAYLRNSDGSAQGLNGGTPGAVNGSSSGLDIGIRHAF